MNDNKYDFYTYGMRTATDMYANNKKILEEIEKKFGKDARLEFECGFNIQLSKTSIKNIENVNLVLKDGALGRNIITDESMRNNSYFGTSGISKKTNDNGEYNDPKTK